MPPRPARVAPASATSPVPAASPSARFRLRITHGDRIAIGPGKIALLEAIDATGSITEAARALGMSYRRAWLLLDQINGALTTPAVDSAKGGLHGGGSALTDAGRETVVLYRRIEARAARAAASDLARLLALLRP